MEKYKIITSKEIGKKIKLRRKELKISQEELAETLNVTYQQVQRYENGTNKLNVENIQLMAEALSVSVSCFFEEEKSSMILGKQIFNLSSDEVELLKSFRKIKNSEHKKIVVQFAKLTAKIIS